jgi:hypothetical protein
MDARVLPVSQLQPAKVESSNQDIVSNQDMTSNQDIASNQDMASNKDMAIVAFISAMGLLASFFMITTCPTTAPIAATIALLS